MTTIREFSEWWSHPVTKAFVAAIEEDIAVHNAVDAVPMADSLEEIGINTLAYMNRVSALKDVTDPAFIRTALRVEEVTDEY